VPLSPAALDALRGQGEGKEGEAVLFRSYAGPRRAETASAALMKRLRSVVKDGKKTIHSLRHRMKDRLRDTHCPESLAREIMGHSEQGVAFNYGSGYALQMKRDALEKVWQGDGKKSADGADAAREPAQAPVDGTGL
jgi:integrase